MSSPAAPGFVAQLKEAMFYQVAPEERADYERELTFTNYARVSLLAIAGGLVNLIYGVGPDVLALHYDAPWSKFSTFSFWLVMHPLLAVFPLVSVPWLRRHAPRTPADIQPRHRTAVRINCWVSILGLMAISLVHQRISSNLMLYMLALALYASAFYVSVADGLSLMLTSLAIFVFALPLYQSDMLTAASFMVIATDTVLIFWLLSRVLYSLKGRSFMQLRTIARQAAELALTNRELAKTNEELAAANRLKSDLLALAAHDLRDPLNVIALGAQSIRDDVPTGNRDVVAGMSASARHMSGLLENLLIEARSETGELTLFCESVDLPRLVSDTVNVYRPLAGAKSIRLHFSADRAALTGPPACVDEARYRQVVSNLISNSLKYSPTGLNVWVSLSYDRNEGHRLVVRDEGPGFEVAERETIFNRFQRGTARPTGGESSTGLGLAIVRSLVKLHGGRVWAESPGMGLGASFFVVVP